MDSIEFKLEFELIKKFRVKLKFGSTLLHSCYKNFFLALWSLKNIIQLKLFIVHAFFMGFVESSFFAHMFLKDYSNEIRLSCTIEENLEEFHSMTAWPIFLL